MMTNITFFIPNSLLPINAPVNNNFTFEQNYAICQSLQYRGTAKYNSRQLLVLCFTLLSSGGVNEGADVFSVHNRLAHLSKMTLPTNNKQRRVKQRMVFPEVTFLLSSMKTESHDFATTYWKLSSHAIDR